MILQSELVWGYNRNAGGGEVGRSQELGKKEEKLRFVNISCLFWEASVLCIEINCSGYYSMAPISNAYVYIEGINFKES